jgi:hypothetical protein
MIITLFEGQRTETYDSLSEAANAAKNWYSDLKEDETPPWDYEIQTFDGLLDAIEAHNKRTASALANAGDYYPKPRLAAVGIEGTSAGSN